jgi:hypothetical protein
MTTSTRDTAKAIRTATAALSAGRLDTARRALVYACTRFGVQRELAARTGRAFKIGRTSEALAVILRICVAKQALRQLEAQRTRNLFTTSKES